MTRRRSRHRRRSSYFWILLLGLWGVLVYEYLGQDEAPPEPQPVAAERTQPARPTPTLEWAPERSPVALVEPPSEHTPIDDASPGMAPSSLTEIRVPAYIKGPAGPEARISNAPPQAPAPPPPAPPRRRQAPPGFVDRDTRHCSVYGEGGPASAEFLGFMEHLHGNLMLDLAPFSPWAKDDRVIVYLFRNQETYRRMTGRPAWSGGASSVPDRLVYLYDSSEVRGIAAHELCHIYYDSFFAGGRPAPLWVSEGLATLFQIERGQAPPDWLRENVDILKRGGGYTLEELMAVTTTAGAGDAKVRLWYAQAYSVVHFLLRTQRKTSFFKFSRNLRDGRSMDRWLRLVLAPLTGRDIFRYQDSPLPPAAPAAVK